MTRFKKIIDIFEYVPMSKQIILFVFYICNFFVYFASNSN